MGEVLAALRIEGGRHDRQPGDALGPLERKRTAVCAPIEAPTTTARSIVQLVHHGLEVAGQRGVGVVAVGRRRRVAVTAGVVEHEPAAGALERARAHHHVAAGRGQSVQADDRRPVAVLLVGELLPSVPEHVRHALMSIAGADLA